MLVKSSASFTCGYCVCSHAVNIIPTKLGMLLRKRQSISLGCLLKVIVVIIISLIRFLRTIPTIVGGWL